MALPFPEASGCYELLEYEGSDAGDFVLMGSIAPETNVGYACSVFVTGPGLVGTAQARQLGMFWFMSYIFALTEEVR